MNSNSNDFFSYLEIVFSKKVLIHDSNIFVIENEKFAFLFQEILELQAKSIPQNYYLNLIENYKEKGVQLIVIYEDQWLHHQEVIRERIASLLGKLIQIHGRKTKAKRIDSDTAFLFLNGYHLQGYVNSKIKYGLYLADELVAVATFAGGRKMRDKPEDFRSYELIQFANKGGFNVVGGLSKLLKAFIENHKPGNIMTYIDRAWSEGESFRKLGFEETGFLKPQQFFIETDDSMRYSKNKKEDTFFVFIPIWNAGSIKLILEIGIKQQT